MIEIQKREEKRAEEQAKALYGFCKSKKGSVACLNCTFHKKNGGRGCAIGYPYQNWGIEE